MRERKRILCIGEMWLGSNSRACFMACRRLGHCIQTIDEEAHFPTRWKGFVVRVVRRVMRPLLVRELTREAKELAGSFDPTVLFVFKGSAVHPDLVRYFNKRNVITVNFYPDVSFLVHGPYIPRALPLYKRVFTTKSWGIADMRNQLGVENITFLEHGFDPELDHPIALSDQDVVRYGADVAFIGTWSPKKQKLLTEVKRAMPDLKMKIWGTQWERSSRMELQQSIMGVGICGEEYSRALQASTICLGILSEARRGSSSGDLTTSRTFNIPACGAFLLHERNHEVLRYFKEDTEVAFFGSTEELIRKIQFYLDNPIRRSTVAEAGRKRCLDSGYSIDDRMREMLRLSLSINEP